MLLRVENILDKLPETLYSYSSNSSTAGASSFPVRNINAFTASYAIQLGKTGEEQSEILVINGSPSGTALSTTGTARFDHNIDTPIFQIHYDKIIFKRSATGTAGSATPIGTQNITPDSLYTEYNDTSGAATYAYKTQYFNSVSGDLSSESDWFVPGGPTFYSLQKLRQRSKDALFNASYLKDDSIIDDWINEWLEEMTNAAIKVNQGFAIGTASYSFGTAGYGTITEAGFKLANKIEITKDGANYYNSTEIPLSNFAESDYFSSIYPRHTWVGDTVFRTLPFGESGTARFSFGKRNTNLVDDIDELPMSLRSYTTGCINYVLYRAYDNDNKTELADKYYNRFMQKKNDFINEMTPRDQTGAKFIDLTEELSGSDINLSDDYL